MDNGKKILLVNVKLSKVPPRIHEVHQIGVNKHKKRVENIRL